MQSFDIQGFEPGGAAYCLPDVQEAYKATFTVTTNDIWSFGKTTTIIRTMGTTPHLGNSERNHQPHLPEMTRLSYYAGVSTVLAGGVIVSALTQRANFYSACILINLILFIYGSFIYWLQRLCYGALRPLEIEQLYEKSWFAITETCLAMTIFREEVGAWFLVMFVALLTGKVWGWIGDGRVEILDQQPPANPRLFHIRLSVSLTMSIIYDLWLMKYTINTVIQQARPNMMVMFLFEFAILTTCSFATGVRYCISLIEARVQRKQTQERLVERRREVREERAEILRQRGVAAAAVAEGGEGTDAAPSTASTAPLPSEDDVDEMDIETPGWEAKGQWVLTLDLISGQSRALHTWYLYLQVTDFIKLGIYITFFVILFMFYGLPIHIVRDVFLTARSFTKRLSAFLRYRRATNDMNQKYADATVEDIQREDTCIICREEMTPWSVTNPQAPPAGPGTVPPARPSGHTVNEQSRPKKLPCGHILHLGCLKRWLERQQACPICRAPVVDPPQDQAAHGAANNGNPPGQGGQPPVPGQQDGPGGAPPAGRPPGRRMRMINLGPLRFAYGQANMQDLANGFGGPQANQDNGVGGGARMYGLELGFPRVPAQPQAQGGANLPATATTLQDHLQQIEQHLVAEINALQITQQQVQRVQLLQIELERLRLMQNGGADPLAGSNVQMPQMPPLVTRPMANSPFQPAIPQIQRHGARPGTAAIPSGSAELPPGVTLPEGWSLLPLQRLDGLGATPTGQVPLPGPVGNVGVGSAPTGSTTSISPMAGGSSNNNLIPTPTVNPDTHSDDSSDGNAIHTPPSIIADQSAPSNVAASAPASASIASNPSASSSSQLPNWGASQLFTDAASTSAIPASMSTSQAPLSDGETQEVHRQAATPQAQGQGQHEFNANTTSTTSTSNPASSENGETSSSTQEKGKARAATVEDTFDEAEGS
ncbi:ERAD-associated E3 ubiquitin-protein ligase [Lachnellula occidentalis]|uniref:RING-type E3 ubiquitin transferase n=1 Tax=Lachnellula occidentalis TaxID=215460 RepID=A0A8H8RHE8_9HELO|nr:ERAD-associated E3 ubiquitin-protein ligase [Lachnellula occidentalis]